MAATVTTKELFDGRISKEKMDIEVDLRIKAGAIRSSFKKEKGKWVLTTEWNVIGEQ